MNFIFRLCCLAALVLLAQDAYATTTLTVNTNIDTHSAGFSSQAAPNSTASTDLGGHTTLRSALEYASTKGGAWIIKLPVGVYSLTNGDLVVGVQANTTITIQGQGTAANTTILQTKPHRMVFLVNYNVNANVVFNLANVTLSGGAEDATDPDGFGGNGGAILAGGDDTAPGNVLALTNVVFSNNMASGNANGGAISMSGGGNLVAANCVFSGNHAGAGAGGSGAGGAIYFDANFNPGNVSIYNSIFVNNIASGGEGLGGAVYLAGANSGGNSYTISQCVFTGNTAAIWGGAMIVESGDLTASFNRITGNTAPAGGGSGLYVLSAGAGWADARNNWWGGNLGPNGTGGDSVFPGASATPPLSNGHVSFSPWMALTDTASPGTISGGSATMTASFLQNSIGQTLTAGQVAALVGAPVTWSGTAHGNFTGQQTTIQPDGEATAIFTNDGTCNNGSGNATVDNATVSAGVTVQCPAINTSQQPASATVGTAIADKATVSGGNNPSGTVTFKLYNNSAGAGAPLFTDTEALSGGTATSAGYTTTATGTLYWVAVYNGDSHNNSVSSAFASEPVTVSAASPTINTTQQPASVTLGSSIADKATVNGGVTPTGTITFKLYNNSTATGAPLFTDTEALSGGTATSAGYTTTVIGAFYWVATYSGDSNNHSVSEGGASEPVTVSPANPTINTTQQPASATVGSTIADRATISGGYNPSGTVTFNLYNNSTGAGAPLFTDTEPLSGGTATSKGYTATATGTFYWAAAYSGDSNNHSVSEGGASEPVTVTPGAATHFAVSLPAPAVAGATFSATVTALDQFNNPASAYSGTVHFTSTDGAAALPADSTLTGGSGTFSLTLKTAGSQTVTATDTANSSITGASGAVAVSAGPATHFALSLPASAAPGVAFNGAVNALDQFNNLASAYSGTVHFTSTDGAAVLPADSTLIAGLGTFSFTLKTVGSQTVTATDTVNSSITGTSGTVVVRHPLIGGSHFLAATVNTPLSVGVSALAALDSDPNGDTLTITGVSAGSAQGGSVKLSGGALTYTPPHNFVGSDQFTYTIGEVLLGGAATSTANVMVGLGTATSVFSYISPPDNLGYIHLRGFGVPGRGYDIEYSSDPSFSTFSLLATVTAASGNGVILYTDTNPTSPRYYRFAAH